MLRDSKSNLCSFLFLVGVKTRAWVLQCTNYNGNTDATSPDEEGNVDNIESSLV